jgi:Flp pilus assembly pilin Flp
VDRGASMVEYGALLMLLSTVIAVVMAVGIPGRVATEVRSAVCTIFDQSGCGERQPPQADGRPPAVPTRPGTGPGRTGPAQSPPPGETGGAQTPDEMSEQFDEAEQAAELAELDASGADREAADSDRQGGDPVEIAKELAVEASGLGDAKRCITEGDLAGCGWTALTFVPVAGWLGKGGKAAKAANKARQLMERFRAFKRVGDAARRRAAALRERARLARERAQTLCNTNSFVAGTPVLLADGTYKPIEDVDIGEWVLAADPVTGRSGGRQVTALITGQGTKRLVTVTVDIAGPGGHRTAAITATDGHPFWVTGEHRWTSAADLDTGDRLRTTVAAGARSVTVRSTREYTLVERVYNLTVDDLHTYHVMVAGTPVLVHNSGAPGPDPCRVGQAGERAAGITKNTNKIQINGRTRIPDELNATTLGEVKNVKYQHLSTQLKDDLAYAQQNRLQFNLYVRRDTRLSGPLQELVDSGQLNLIRNLP